MPYQPVPDVAQVRIEGRLDRQLTLNDLYFEISGGGITPTNLSALATAVDAWVGLSLQPLLSEDWSAVRVIATDLTTQTGPSVESGLSGVGGVGVESAPGNVAACVSFRTAFRGRNYRGRNFLPGIPNSVILLNTLTPTFIDDVLTAYGSLVGAGTFLPGWQWVVVSRFLGGVPRATGIASPVVQAVFTTDTVRSMRTREVGHGA